MTKKKLKLGIFSLTCCEGCQVVILDLGKRLLELLPYFELAQFHLIEEEKERPYYDIALVEGTPLTKKNFKHLKAIRKKSKLLGALGSCAALGGIQKNKNYEDKNKIISKVYKRPELIFNPQVKPLKDIIPVDFEILGCPIDGEEFLWALRELKDGKIPKIPQRPICYECQIREYKCLLQKGKPCMGPITQAGCKAVCPANGFICEGCRGPLQDCNIRGLEKIMQKNTDKKRIEKIFKIYGAYDDIKKVQKELELKEIKK